MQDSLSYFNVQKRKKVTSKIAIFKITIFDELPRNNDDRDNGQETKDELAFRRIPKKVKKCVING